MPAAIKIVVLSFGVSPSFSGFSSLFKTLLHSLSCFGSPGTWESHPETLELVVLQGRVGPAGDEEEEEEEELSSSCEEEGEEDRDADEEGEGDEDTPTSAPGSSLAARNPYALLGEDEC